MKILLVGNFLSGTIGTTGAAEELAHHLIASGSWVLTTSSQLGRSRRVIDVFSTICFYRKSYDVANVEVYSGLAFLLAEFACGLLSLLRKPFIVTLHGGGLVAFSERWPRRVKSLLQMANAVVTPSAYLQYHLRKFRSDIHYLPNAIEIDNYSFKLREKPRPKICWLRAFHTIYNPEMAIEAVTLLRVKYPSILLTMIGRDTGDGSRQRVERLIHERSLRSNVLLCGSISKADVPLRLQEADIFINTTRFESFGIAVMEAAAVGLPIVSTAVGELPYLWQHEKNALLVPSGDSKAMASAVERILTEEALASRLSVGARQKAESFTWSIVLPKWQAVFHELRKDG